MPRIPFCSHSLPSFHTPHAQTFWIALYAPSLHHPHSVPLALHAHTFIHVTHVFCCCIAPNTTTNQIKHFLLFLPWSTHTHNPPHRTSPSLPLPTFTFALVRAPLSPHYRRTNNKSNLLLSCFVHLLHLHHMHPLHTHTAHFLSLILWSRNCLSIKCAKNKKKMPNKCTLHIFNNISSLLLSFLPAFALITHSLPTYLHRTIYPSLLIAHHFLHPIQKWHTTQIQ